MIDEIVNKIKGRIFPGSSTANGVLYHELPFLEFNHIKSHRKNTLERWNTIKQHIDFKDKTVIDIGCSSGAFSILAKLDGASKVIGIDYDLNNINVAKYMANHFNLQNIEFVEQRINEEFISSMQHYDIAICLSVWMWLLKQEGEVHSDKMMYEISRKVDILIFEIAGENDGMAGIKQLKQENVINFIKQRTVYTKFQDIGIDENWLGNRRTIVCSGN